MYLTTKCVFPPFTLAIANPDFPLSMLALFFPRVERAGEATATMDTGRGHTMATVEPVGEEVGEAVWAVTAKIQVVVGVAIRFAQELADVTSGAREGGLVDVPPPSSYCISVG